MLHIKLCTKLQIGFAICLLLQIQIIPAIPYHTMFLTDVLSYVVVIDFVFWHMGSSDEGVCRSHKPFKGVDDELGLYVKTLPLDGCEVV